MPYTGCAVSFKGLLKWGFTVPGAAAAFVCYSMLVIATVRGMIFLLFKIAMILNYHCCNDRDDCVVSLSQVHRFVQAQSHLCREQAAQHG